MSKKKNSWKDNVATVVVLLIVAGFVVGFARVNNIHSFDDASDYIFALSHKADDKYNSCLDNNGKWTCTGKKKQVQQSGKRLAPPHVDYEAQLKALPTAETKNVKYNRKQWRHWIGEPCDTRQRVLIRDGENVKSDKRSCKIRSGHWVSSYDGKEFDNSRDLDVDRRLVDAPFSRHLVRIQPLPTLPRRPQPSVASAIPSRLCLCRFPHRRPPRRSVTSRAAIARSHREEATSTTPDRTPPPASHQNPTPRQHHRRRAARPSTTATAAPSTLRQTLTTHAPHALPGAGVAEVSETGLVRVLWPV